MRLHRVATALVVLAAGAATAAAVRRLGARRRPAVLPAPVAAPAVVAGLESALAVVLPFPRRSVDDVVASQPAAPVRCGDTGGVTKAGAPCAARATAGGRCHHHRLAA